MISIQHLLLLLVALFATISAQLAAESADTQAAAVPQAIVDLQTAEHKKRRRYGGYGGHGGYGGYGRRKG